MTVLISTFFYISTASFCIELLKLSSVKTENSKTDLHLLLLKPIWLEFSDTKKTIYSEGLYKIEALYELF